MNAPALIARLRVFGHEIEALAEELEADTRFSRRLAGGDLADVATAHNRRLSQAFDVVEHGISDDRRKGYVAVRDENRI
jgi:hypothetical protein